MATDIQLTSLVQGDVETRYRAAQALSRAPATAEVLAALVQALGDEAFFETPGDYDAPTFIHCVANAAAESLGERAALVLPALAQRMKGSGYAARLGARLLCHCGEAGLPILQETMSHFDPSAREAALAALAVLTDKLSKPPPDQVIKEQLSALNDPSSGVNYAAVSTLKEILRKHPGLDLPALAPEGLVAALTERLRRNPGAGTYAEALDFFSVGDDVIATFVELAAHGSHCAADVLLHHRQRLDDGAVDRLVGGKKTPQLVTLLGALEERATAAVPELAELLNDQRLEAPALIALLRIPAGVEIVLPRLDDYFVKFEELRGPILHYHPRPSRLSDQVPTRLRKRYETTKDLSFLRALVALGPLAVSQLPWLLQQLEPYGVPDLLRSYAIAIIAGFGEEARPAFPRMMGLLDRHDTRYPVLKALTRLGPLAAEDFLPLLEVLESESSGWSLFEKNNDLLRLREALDSLRGISVAAH